MPDVTCITLHCLPPPPAAVAQASHPAVPWPVAPLLQAQGTRPPLASITPQVTHQASAASCSLSHSDELGAEQLGQTPGPGGPDSVLGDPSAQDMEPENRK